MNSSLQRIGLVVITALALVLPCSLGCGSSSTISNDVVPVKPKKTVKSEAANKPGAPVPTKRERRGVR